MGFSIPDHDINQVWKHWKAFVGNGKRYCLGSKGFHQKPVIDYEQFLEIVGIKNFKKIERPEVDPYGEEDWGYEEIN